MLFWVLLSTAAVIAPTFSLPTRTGPIEDNDYRIALYRDASRKSGDRQMDPLGYLLIPIHQRMISNVAKSDERRQTSDSLDPLGGGHLLRRDIEELGGGHILRRDIDQLGGGHLLRRDIDELGGGHILRRAID